MYGHNNAHSVVGIPCLTIITAHVAKWVKVMFSQVFVCPLGGAVASTKGQPPESPHFPPPGQSHNTSSPPSQSHNTSPLVRVTTPPPLVRVTTPPFPWSESQHLPPATIRRRAVCILLECILVVSLIFWGLCGDDQMELIFARVSQVSDCGFTMRKYILKHTFVSKIKLYDYILY